MSRILYSRTRTAKVLTLIKMEFGRSQLSHSDKFSDNLDLDTQF